jgi:hypothetical protein
VKFFKKPEIKKKKRTMKERKKKKKRSKVNFPVQDPSPCLQIASGLFLGILFHGVLGRE